MQFAIRADRPVPRNKEVFFHFNPKPDFQQRGPLLSGFCPERLFTPRPAPFEAVSSFADTTGASSFFCFFSSLLRFAVFCSVIF